MFYKEIFSALAIAITFYAFLPYIHSIKDGVTRPHVFSWIIWGSTTFIVFLATLAEKGGAGAWPIGISGIITIYVAFLAYVNKSDTSITPVDWVFFLAALGSIPLWYFTSDPVWSVVILTCIDAAGFVPTFRKAFYQPFSENLIFYNLFIVRNTFVLVALYHYSLTTVLFPATIAFLTLLFVVMVLYRQQVLRNEH